MKRQTERTGHEKRRARQRTPEYRAKRNARDRAKREPAITLRKNTMKRLMEAQRAYEEEREKDFREAAAVMNVTSNEVRAVGEVSEQGDPALTRAIQSGEISIGTARAIIRKNIDRIKRANRQEAEARQRAAIERLINTDQVLREKIMQPLQSGARKLSEAKLSEAALAHMNELRAKYGVTPKYGVTRKRRVQRRRKEP